MWPPFRYGGIQKCKSKLLEFNEPWKRRAFFENIMFIFIIVVYKIHTIYLRLWFYERKKNSWMRKFWMELFCTDIILT